MTRKGLLNQKKITELFSRFQESNPSPKTELKYRSHFQLLIAVVLSAQATDESVNKATLALFKDAPDACAMKALGEENIKNYIKSIGLFNSKAKHIYQTCIILCETYKGRVPSQRAQLESLPGVGRKTANVVLNTAFKQKTMAVDTHIFRVANRLGLVHERTPLAVERSLLLCIPDEFILNAHHWLILHGRYVCTARKPHCCNCSVRDICSYTKKTT